MHMKDNNNITIKLYLQGEPKEDTKHIDHYQFLPGQWVSILGGELE